MASIKCILQYGEEQLEKKKKKKLEKKGNLEQISNRVAMNKDRSLCKQELQSLHSAR